MSYATLDDARNSLVAVSTGDNPILLTNLNTVTRRARQLSLWGFEPELKTVHYEIVRDRVDTNRRTFILGDAILELSSVLVNDVALALTTRVTPYPSNSTLFDTLRLVDTSDNWYTVNSPDEWPSIAKVTAYYGMNTDYANAWYSADTIQDAGGISAADTSLTVADVDGTGRDGETPRISAGNLLRIENEFLRVLATNTTTNVVTVRRGVNGTTAAAHAINTAVEVWYTEWDIRAVVARQAGLMYSRRGAYEQQAILNDGVYTYPPDLLPELRNVVMSYQNVIGTY